MDKLPAHLEKILRVTERGDGYMNGKIVCECGCGTFGIRYFGEVSKSGCIGVQAHGENRYAARIMADCRGCGKEWELFDFAKHGYDGLICEDGVSVSDEELISFTNGSERDFEVEMGFDFDDEEQFLEEVVDNPPEGMNFTPDDRVNIWSWVDIGLKCAKSGKELKSFVNIELS